jgi:hypothetical protein
MDEEDDGGIKEMDNEGKELGKLGRLLVVKAEEWGEGEDGDEAREDEEGAVMDEGREEALKQPLVVETKLSVLWLLAEEDEDEEEEVVKMDAVEVRG